MALSTQARTRLYGPPGEVPRVVVTTPWGVRTQVHKLVAATFLDACREAAAVSPWRPQRCDGFNHRAIRGSTAVSLHSYALAWDFFITPPTMPPPGGVWNPTNGLPPSFAAPFLRRGFTWGAVWARKDVPHIEWNGPPPIADAQAVIAPRRFLPMLSDDEQRELLNHLRTVGQRVARIEDALAAAASYRADTRVEATKHRREMRDTLAALMRRLFGVDPVTKDDTAPFWTKR